jgi:predicted phosphoribosyltransferase
LAAKLRAYKGRQDCIVMGLPRGGIVVAHEVARELGAPLDACIVRKLGAPFQPELAMGAIGPGGIHVLSEDIIRGYGIAQSEVDAEIEAESRELARREAAYLGGRPHPDVRGKTVILVDDGIATGATMEAGIRVLRAQGAARIVAAAGAAPAETLKRLARIADDAVSVLTPAAFGAISMWFEAFEQVSDEEVRQLLGQAAGGAYHSVSPSVSRGSA